MSSAAAGPTGPEEAVAEALAALRGAAEPGRAADMARYMRDRFTFLGVTSPQRRRLTAPLRAASRSWSAPELLDAADRLWSVPEREPDYVACDLLRARSRRLGPADLPELRRLVCTDSWWDTVDPLSSVVGDVVFRHPALVPTMSVWVDDDDLWVVRVALLHQLGRRADTDLDRLFDFCTRRAGDTEFFVRKAVGWALRDAARTYPDQVRAYVVAHPELSGLSRREAMKHLGG